MAKPRNPVEFIGFLLRNILSQPSRRLGGRTGRNALGGLPSDPGRPRRKKRRMKPTPGVSQAFRTKKACKT